MLINFCSSGVAWPDRQRRNLPCVAMIGEMQSIPVYPTLYASQSHQHPSRIVPFWISHHFLFWHGIGPRRAEIRLLLRVENVQGWTRRFCLSVRMFRCGGAWPHLLETWYKQWVALYSLIICLLGTVKKLKRNENTRKLYWMKSVVVTTQLSSSSSSSTRVVPSTSVVLVVVDTSRKGHTTKKLKKQWASHLSSSSLYKTTTSSHEKAASSSSFSASSVTSSSRSIVSLGCAASIILRSLIILIVFYFLVWCCRSISWTIAQF